MTDMRRISIDGTEIEVDGAMTLIQACEQAGVEIPRFCYHERLTIAGNCRMCLVEVVGGPPKPAASCAMQVRDLRPGPEGEPPQVLTASPMVRRAREGVMQFLLINHPLDCPICDQGGECDLQDQAMAYGAGASRYRESKRAVDDLDLGPLVETHMTRCISCTRCVRFTTEVAGATLMGQTGRGEDAEIATYLGRTLDSNLQGNIVDLCPVGALVSKPYAFRARPWELEKTETVDAMDALGSSIRVDCKGGEVMRILPRNHDGVNEEWISDKTRHVWDGLRSQRLDQPYVRSGGKLRPASWDEALAAAAAAMTRSTVAALVGDLAPVEAAYALRGVVESLNGRIECRTDGAFLPADNRSAYVGTARVADIDEAAAIYVIGSDPAAEAPVLNARIRKAWLRGAEVFHVGAPAALTCAAKWLGEGIADLAKLAESASRTEGAIVILGQGALRGETGAAALGQAMKLADRLGGAMLVLHTAAARVGAIDAGCTTEGGMASAMEGAQTVFSLGADEVDIPAGPFVIYQGSHGDHGAHRADVILPGAAYTEENGIFVNTEGRPQRALRAAHPPGEAKENWAVLRALSGALGAALPYASLAELRARLFAEVPHLGDTDCVPENDWKPAPEAGPLEGRLENAVADFYLTNPIARASALMAEMSARAARRMHQEAAQ